MANLLTLNHLISNIHNKLRKYQKGNTVIERKEVKDFIYFLRKDS